MKQILALPALACILSLAREGQAITTSQYDLAATTTTPGAAVTTQPAGAQQVVIGQAPQATSQSLTESQKLQHCKDRVGTVFQTASTTEQSASQFTKFVTEVCPTLDLRMPNGVKVSSCFHAGFFLVRNLRPLADKVLTTTTADAQADYDTYIEDFCTTYGEVLPMRTEFISQIYQIEEQEDFSKACYDNLSTRPKLNTWFDPIDPMSSITQQEICDLHYKLFSTLKDKQRTSLSEFVSFSYLASLDLFMNAHQQEDYENCINMDVIDDPNQWATTFITEHPSFKIWDNDSKLNIAAQTATAITSQCADQVTCAATGQCPSCDGCAIGISRIFKNFELYLNGKFAEVFKDHSEKMFNKLHEANLSIET